MNLIKSELHSAARIVRNRILSAVSDERDRQDEKWGGVPGLDRGDNDVKYPAVLGEEFGEVCQAWLEGDLANLRTELVQVAAVAVAWVEELDNAYTIEGAA
jgi:NTP pyrophosphatase (non-canonical NTP hydrolase)